MILKDMGHLLKSLTRWSLRVSSNLEYSANLWICDIKLLLSQEIVLRIPNNYTGDEISWILRTQIYRCVILVWSKGRSFHSISNCFGFPRLLTSLPKCFSIPHLRNVISNSDTLLKNSKSGMMAKSQKSRWLHEVLITDMNCKICRLYKDRTPPVN